MNTVEEAIEALKRGEMIVVSDDETRENEGDIIASAQNMTTEQMAFIARYACGVICMPISKEVARQLKLGPMVEDNTDNHETAFTVSIDYIDTTTGVSAAERALTVREAAKEGAKAEDFRRPGHIFPLLAKDGGVRERNGHTEATVELMKLAGLRPVGVCCEIMNEDGTMARRDDLDAFSKKHSLIQITIAELIKYVEKNIPYAEKCVTTKLPTKYGVFDITGYKNLLNGREEVVLTMGDVEGGENVLTRIHSECMTGDVFSSCKCDCGQQLELALSKIAEEGRGILVYLRQEGRDIGLFNKLRAYRLQNEGMDTVEANLALGFPEDNRKYDVAADILKQMGVKSIELMTNNPDKLDKLKKLNINVSKRIPLEVEYSAYAKEYINTKKIKMGHIFKEV
ncbi:MAG: GTP cyclohydrolase II [Firmicutes bacterium]|nr:GTP cyclohydrolase II [Bacillota bacterium]